MCTRSFRPTTWYPDSIAFSQHLFRLQYRSERPVSRFLFPQTTPKAFTFIPGT